MAKVIPETNKEMFNSLHHEISLWKVRAKELQKEEPRLRNSPEFKDIRFILFPDDSFMNYWRFIVLLLLLYTITITPYRVSFVDVDTLDWQIADLFVDGLYFIDVLINCILAYYDNDMNVIISHKKIFLNYLTGWFFIDLCPCVPFDMIIQAYKNYSGLVRLSRLPRLYKLIKLTKMMRLSTVGKAKNRIAMYMSNLLKIDAGLERFLWLIITFIINIHLLACCWAFIGRFMLYETDKNWIMQGDYQDLSNFDLYICAVYWSVTTLTTAGYGDIHAWNKYERIISIGVMICGIFIYSFFVSSLTNIVISKDDINCKLERKRDIINSLAKQHNISPEFYRKLMDAIEYNQKHDRTDLDALIEDLPINLRTQLLIVIYKQFLENNAFFEDKQAHFVAYIAPLLKPYKAEEGDHIYKTGDLATEIYFIIKGEVAMIVEPDEDTKIPFNFLSEGYYFGETDLLMNENHERSFSVKALKRTELLVLPNDDFENVLQNFEEEGLSILMAAKDRQSRLKERAEQAIEEYKSKSRIKRFQSFPVLTPVSKKELLKIVKKIQKEEDDKITINEDFEKADLKVENELLIPTENKETDALESLRSQGSPKGESFSQDSLKQGSVKSQWSQKSRFNLESFKSQSSSQSSLFKNKSIFDSIIQQKFGDSSYSEEKIEKKLIKLEEKIEKVKEVIKTLCKLQDCQLPDEFLEENSPE
ncbi:unnamed protein product [Blepharisma stoltei]|uniref:Cyclic nucleotide-binding domain-containing protein n=1 Tax=Blepharisma stoltei TaxID=1481888 RepID=A0AAU9KBR5_9CILI|nr:unnamed protein product [Blepharisma stoltei]